MKEHGHHQKNRYLRNREMRDLRKNLGEDLAGYIADLRVQRLPEWLTANGLPAKT